MHRIPAGRRCRIALLSSALAAVVPACLAHEVQAAREAATDASLDAQLVTTGLYLITGGGAHSLLRFSARGLVLVDGKRPGTHAALMKQVRRISKISDMPLRALIVTGPDESHTGNNAEFIAAHVPVVGHANVARRMEVATNAAPIVTYERDYTLKLGAVQLQLLHFGAARTDADTVVHFPDLKVIAVGDLYTPGLPEPDAAAGGSWSGWADALAQILKLQFDIVVPSSGPLVGRAELEAFKGRIEALASSSR